MVLRILPSRDLVRQLLDYDAETGAFTWRPRPREMFPSEKGFMVWNGRFAGKAAGHANGLRRTIAIAATSYLAHRLAWLIHYGEPVPDLIDHADLNALNNSISNLRAASKGQNMSNAQRRKDNTIGAKGVHRQHNGRFFARVTVGGVLHHLGTFDTVEEAAEARQNAAARLHGKFARFD